MEECKCMERKGVNRKEESSIKTNSGDKKRRF